MEVVAQKLVIVSQYANDFSGACNYFSAQVSHLHGGAQLENSKYTKKHNVSAKYGLGSRDGGRSGGRGCFGGCGRFGGCGGGGNDRSNFINGVDVSDPTQNITDEEWRKLAYNAGWLYVAQVRERMNGQGRGGRDGCSGQNDGHGGSHNVGAIGADRNEGGQGTEMAGENNVAGGDHGAQHGCGIGRGAYRH
jgi:hypothetical protein